MKQQKKVLAVLVAATLAAAGSGAQATTKKPVHHGKRRVVRTRRTTERRPVESATERQLTALHDQVLSQQAQIDALRNQLVTREQQSVQAAQSVADAQAQVVTATAASVQATQQSTQNAQDVQQLKASVGDLQTKDQTLTETVVANQAQVQEQINSPTTIHYKGVTFQPIAFFAFEGVYRQRSVNSDINTPFNSIPVPGANEGHVSELNFSGRQSRLGLLVQGNAGTYKLTGYFEGDFLGAGVTSNNNESNSYVFRQRQFWGQAALANGFTLTGGQMWSLVTEDGHGTDNRTEITPVAIDPQYAVGFSWARQPGLRLQQRFGTGARTFTVAASVEQAQITNFTAASSVTAAVPTNFFFAGAGQNGGLYNAFNGTYANNVAPDTLVKAAMDVPHVHFEAGGIARFMRDYYYPITGTSTTAAGVSSYTLSTVSESNTALGGGAFGSLRVIPVKPLEIAVQAMAGPGVGRYGASQLADATVKPSGALEPIKNYHGLFTLMTHEGKKLDIYAYYGGEYAQRTVYTVTTGAFARDTIGYGTRNLNNATCYALPLNPGSSTGGTPAAPAGCTSPTRYIQEGLIGLTFRAIDSPQYGRLQYSMNYQYLQRALWSGTVGTATGVPTGPRAEDSMAYVSMRYYIP